MTTIEAAESRYAVSAHGFPEVPRQSLVINAFVEATTAAGSTQDTTKLLQAATANICALLGVGRGVVFLRRADGTFHGVAGHEPGAGLDLAPEQFTVAAGDCELTREAVRRRGPVRAAEAQFDVRALPVPVRSAQGQGLLVVPLVLGDDVVGVLYVDDARRRHVYTEEHLATVGQFGQLVAAHLRQAQISGRVELLAQRNELLEQVSVLHNRLIRLIHEGVDARAVVTLLSELINNPVMLLRPNFQVKCWAAPAVLNLESPPALPLRSPSHPVIRDAIEPLSPDHPSVTIPPHPALGVNRRHLLRSLVIEGRHVGYLDIAEMGSRFQATDSQLVEHGASYLSLLVLGELQRAEAEGPAREDFMLDLLRGTRDARQLIRRGTQLGFDLERPHLFVRFAAQSCSTAPPPARHLAHVLRAVRRVPRCEGSTGIAVPGAVMVVLPLSGQPTRAALRRLNVGLSDALADITERTGIRRAVVSSTCREVEHYPRAAEETHDVDGIVLAANAQCAGIMFAQRLGALRVLAGGGGVDRSIRFAEDFFSPLLRIDAETGGDLVPTLRAYLTAGAQIRNAAATLGVHENTIRYRLGRISKVTGMVMRDFDSLLTSQLAFQVLELTGRYDELMSGGPGQSAGDQE